MANIKKTAIRHDQLLLKKAKNIFGDIVNNAFITTCYINCGISKVSARLDKSKFCDSDLSKIQYDSETIWIEFSNGKIVEFNNSEWASIVPANTELSYNA